MRRRLSSWSGASGRCSTGALSQAGSPPHLLTNGKPESSEATGPIVVAAWREQNPEKLVGTAREPWPLEEDPQPRAPSVASGERLLRLLHQTSEREEQLNARRAAQDARGRNRNRRGGTYNASPIVSLNIPIGREQG